MKGSGQPFITFYFWWTWYDRTCFDHLGNRISLPFKKKLLLHTWNLIMCWFPVLRIVICKFYHNTAYISIIWCSGESLNQKIVSKRHSAAIDDYCLLGAFCIEISAFRLNNIRCKWRFLENVFLYSLFVQQRFLVYSSVRFLRFFYIDKRKRWRTRCSLSSNVWFHHSVFWCACSLIVISKHRRFRRKWWLKLVKRQLCLGSLVQFYVIELCNSLTEN